MSLTDFWWLSPGEKAKYRYVELIHREVGRDDHQYEQRATSDIDSIDQWRDKFHNTNIYRSLRLTSTPLGGDELLGPFLVDIDNEQDLLEDALDVTRKAVACLQDSYGVRVHNLRVLFTGHKGFNLEVRPRAIGLQGAIKDQIRESADKLNHLVELLPCGKTWPDANQVSEGGTLIDRIYGSRRSGYRLKHPDVRLHESINEWISSDGAVKARMKIQLTIDELYTLTATEIVARSERAARCNN